MIPTALRAITAEHIHALVADEVRERQELDFKEKLPDRSDGAREDFIADVCAFANANGGDIIYGIQDRRDNHGNPTGVAGAIIGLTRINHDREMASLMQLLDQYAQPKISGIDWRAIECAGDGPVIVLRVPQSFSAPHMTTFRGLHRFYTRSASQKRILDVDEIRSAFLASESSSERIRDFRARRLLDIRAAETPVPLTNARSQLIVHVIPVSAMSGRTSWIDPRISRDLLLPPADGTYGGSRFNLDGAVGYWAADTAVASYLQIFRSSALEFVYTNCSYDNEGQLVLRDEYIDTRIRASLGRSQEIFHRFNREPPYVLLVSLLGVRGATTHVRWPEPSAQSLNYTRDELLLPDVWIQSFPQKYDDIVRPVMDVLWQACGHPRSTNYDESGCRKSS